VSNGGAEFFAAVYEKIHRHVVQGRAWPHAVYGNLPRTTMGKFPLKDLHTLDSLLPLCSDAPRNCFHACSMRSVCYCHGSRVFQRRAGPLLEHCGVTRVGVRGNTVGMFCIPQSSQALIVSPSIAVFPNALLAASNGLRLLAPAVLLVNLRTNALDGSLAKPFGTPLDTPRVEARGTAAGFLRPFLSFMKLIEGVYGASRRLRRCRR
jgi:hypothetical protein